MVYIKRSDESNFIELWLIIFHKLMYIEWLMNTINLLAVLMCVCGLEPEGRAETPFPSRPRLLVMCVLLGTDVILPFWLHVLKQPYENAYFSTAYLQP